MRHPVLVTGVICALCLTACVSFISLLENPGRKAAGDTGDTVESSMTEAFSLEDENLEIYVDGRIIQGASSGDIRISGDGEVSVPVSDLNDIFDCDVVQWDNGSASLTKPLSISDDSRELLGKLDVDSSDCVLLSEAAELAGYGFELNKKEPAVYLKSPGTVKEQLPEIYDLRYEGKISSIRDQGNEGNCWAFAALSALESALLPDQVWDFSEDNLVNMSGFSTGGSGGDYNMALAYMLSWRGPVTEDEDPYGDGYSPEGLSAAVHLQDAVILNNRDEDQIKSLIYHNGAVQSAIYCPSDSDTLSVYYNSENASYYYPESHDCSHDIDIIGWDDNYPAENFNIRPSADGAFICRNSWGESFGEDGYFYISYEDPNIGIYGAAYTGVEPSDNYDNIYQADMLGWTGSIGYNGPRAVFASVYDAAGAETIRAAGFYSTGADTWYDVYIVHDISGDAGNADLSKREYIRSGYCADKGFFTVDISGAGTVKSGERFAVVVDIYTKDSEHPVAMEYARNSMSAGADISDGETYMSEDGNIWTRLEQTQECNACLKVYTDND